LESQGSGVATEWIVGRSRGLVVINFFVKFPTADQIPRQISDRCRCFRQWSQGI